MIPKIIHYCWFGRGEMPKLMKKCLKSWKKFCPDWQIIEWNEDNFDIHSTLWTKQAYEAKKFAFVSDYVRLKALCEMGGVYLDTDVELVKPLDRFSDEEGYVGFACTNGLSTGLVAAKPGHPYIKTWFDHYLDQPFLTENGQNLIPNTEYSTEILVRNGLLLNDEKQSICGMTVYPQTYFCPLHVDSFRNVKSKDTYAIHYFLATWRSQSARKSFRKAKWHNTPLYHFGERLRYLPNRLLRRLVGDDRIDRLKQKLRGH